MSQESLAKEAKTTKQYISNLERNAPHPITGAPPQPTMKVVDRIAGALDCPLAEARLAAGYAPPQEGEERTDQRILFLFKALSPEDQDVAADLVEVLWHRRSRPGIRLAVAGKLKRDK